ncbi:MAG: alpha-L-fucosidase [Bacteroidales bacterium]|nr:alpha-L-fucosidase [Bacteroidales bacterium]
MEFIGFIHFSINTFTDKEWGYGNESPSLFNPSSLDARQWARVAKEAGMKQLILTAKHHDGFCLWPSAYTDHSVKNSPWRGGEGDLVKEFTDACREYGLKCGLYLSPWDRNRRDYGKSEYIDYYRKQLTELLTNYGEISEIWFDGANGGDGFYGGANEIRHIDREAYYDWDSTFRLVYSLQPDIIIFSDAGPGCRWIGNERGIAGETCWSTITADSLTIGASKQAYLNTGDPHGTDWIPGECDVSIRPGWFYHESQDSLVKSLDELIEIYYGSVGRNGVLLLNIPPDQRGLIHEADVERLQEFSEFIRETFDENLASGIEVSDVVKLPDTVDFNLIMLGEDIARGQRVHSFAVESFQHGEWNPLASGTTIGYKRILEVPSTVTSMLRFTFESEKGTPMITTFGLYNDARKAGL